MSGKVTPAVQALQKLGIDFRLLEYDYDPAAGAIGLAAAEAMGVDPALVYKTLVTEVDGAKLVVAVIPVAAKLNLKAVAAATDGRKAEMADTTKAERSSGYVKGGISPLGQRKALSTLVDDSAAAMPEIIVNGGRRGLQIAIAPVDLVRATAGRMLAISK